MHQNKLLLAPVGVELRVSENIGEFLGRLLRPDTLNRRSVRNRSSPAALVGVEVKRTLFELLDVAKDLVGTLLLEGVGLLMSGRERNDHSGVDILERLVDNLELILLVLRSVLRKDLINEFTTSG